MELWARGETCQSVIGLNKTNLLLENFSDLIQQARGNMIGDRIVSEKHKCIQSVRDVCDVDLLSNVRDVDLLCA